MHYHENVAWPIARWQSHRRHAATGAEAAASLGGNTTAVDPQCVVVEIRELVHAMRLWGEEEIFCYVHGM